MKSIQFLIAVHNHQPVGNFESIFRQGFEKCYHPFLKALEKHPQFRLSLHYSGSLLEWLEEHQPDFLHRLRALVDRGQVELLSGGFYEPLLPFIPTHDALGQIHLNNQYLRRRLNAHPRGLWLVERVWNPNLPKILSSTGLQYTIVDDTHFRFAGLPEDEMFGYYVTEQEGFPLAIFPIHKRLRYAIPFRRPEETIEALRFWATDSGNLAVTYADDGEKFGLWPGTYHWVYEEGWLEKFIAALEENQEWVHLIPFSEYMEKYPPQGRAYLPPVAYDEMMEWALPALSAIGYEDMIAELKREGRYEKYRPFLRGGSWENFLVKYPESNHMHKKMLYVSQKVHQILGKDFATPKDFEQTPPPALTALWKGQANCSYWHGLFGGLYLNHLRHAVYRNLITAERLAEITKWGGERYLHHDVCDLDKDLSPEIIVTSPDLGAIIKPNYGGALIEFDYRPQKFNLTNVLTRRPEAYHRKLKKALAAASTAPPHPQSIHNFLIAKEDKLEEALMYDWYTRYSFLDHFLGEDTTFEQFQRCQYPELGNFVNQPYELIQVKTLESSGRMSVLLKRSGGLYKREGKVPVDLHKRFLFHRDQAAMEVEYEIVNPSPAEVKIWFGVEMNLTLLAGSDPQRSFLFPGIKVEDCRLISRGILSTVENVRLRDEAVGFEISMDIYPQSELWRFPLETVSQSESGYEKTYQGSVLLFHWRFQLKPGEKKNLSLVLSCEEI
jgi:4-alpha-glucanotransferase